MSYAVVGATFLAATVEWVEALTIVLAVGMFRGWRSAFLGTGLAFVALAALVIAFGAALTSHVDIAAARAVVGIFLLLFGTKWLLKAIQRSSGLKSLHDESKAFEDAKESLTGHGTVVRGATTTAFAGVFLEGLEVVFIVVALGGLQNLGGAVAGAIAALIAICILGIVLRRPLTRIPENATKYLVGIMLTSFGTFFAGEGLGVHWWHDDASILVLILAYGLVSLSLVWALRQRGGVQGATVRRVANSLSGMLGEVWSFFVDEHLLGVGAIAAIFGTAAFTADFSNQRSLAGVLLAAGVMVSVVLGLTSSLSAASVSRPTEASKEGDLILGTKDGGADGYA